jgi:hypothetical protein
VVVAPVSDALKPCRCVIVLRICKRQGVHCQPMYIPINRDGIIKTQKHFKEISISNPTKLKLGIYRSNDLPLD